MRHLDKGDLPRGLPGLDLGVRTLESSNFRNAIDRERNPTGGGPSLTSKPRPTPPGRVATSKSLPATPSLRRAVALTAVRARTSQAGDPRAAAKATKGG
jgi:hypothetical protein